MGLTLDPERISGTISDKEKGNVFFLQMKCDVLGSVEDQKKHISS